MNSTYKKPLLMAIMAAVGGLVSIGGTAAPLTPDSTGAYTPAKLPLEAKEATTSYFAVYPVASGVNAGVNAGDLEAYIYTIANYPVSAAKTLSVKLTLTNGAKFQTVPKLVCPITAGGGSVAAGISAISLATVTAADAAKVASAVNGTTAFLLSPLSTGNMASVTFEFPQGFTIPSNGSGACLLTYSAALAAAAASTSYLEVLKGGAAGQDINMSVEVTYQDVFASVTKTSTVSMIKFVTAYVATVTPPANSVTIDVATESKKFTLSNSTLTTVSGGMINVSASVANIRNASGTFISATDLFTSATLTLEGDSLATLGSISFVEGACSTPLGTPLSVSPSSTSAAISLPMGTNNGYDAMVSGTTALHVCLSADGIKVMNPGQITITVNGITPAGGSFEIVKADLVSVGRNGTVIRVLNIPNTKATADRSFIRFYNTSSQPVTVTGTLYGQDGKVLGTSGVKLFDPLYPNDVQALGADALSEKIQGAGKTADWTGRAWLMIQAPVSSDLFKVQSLIRSPNGALINVSADATD